MVILLARISVAEILKFENFASVKTCQYTIRDSEAFCQKMRSQPDIMFAFVRIVLGNPQQEVVNFLAGDSLLGNAKSRPLWPLILKKPNLLL
ncbi:hypothetical protein Tco_0332771 [Tanacetum coccineum]